MGKPRLHHLLDQRNRHWLGEWKVDGAFRREEALKLVLELSDDRGRGKQAAVLRERTVPDQYALVLESRNLVADDLNGFGRHNGADGFSNFSQRDTRGCGSGGDVLVDTGGNGVCSFLLALSRFGFLHVNSPRLQF